MAKTATVKPQDARAIAEIVALGFDYTVEDLYPIDQLDFDNRIQVRETYSPPAEVERFRIQMRESLDKFPAIVLTKDGAIGDGNTRISAALKNKLKFFRAIVLDVSFKDADEKTADTLFILAATLNGDNGVGLTGRERRRLIERFIRRGVSTEETARRIGVGVGTIRDVKREIAAARKLGEVGLTNGAASVKGASLRALGSDTVQALNLEPFKGLAELAHDSGLNAREIVDIAKQVKETGSDEAGLAKLGEVRIEMGERIKERKLTGTSKPPEARQLRQHLGFVTKYDGREGALVETNEAVATQHLEAVRAALRVLTRVEILTAGKLGVESDFAPKTTPVEVV